MVEEAGCNPDMFKTICSSVDKLDKVPWKEVEVELEAKGVSKESCKAMEKLTSLKGEPFELLKRLKEEQIFVKESAKTAETLLEM